MAKATVSQALALLRGDASIVTEGLLSGEYALWLGSGISREKVPGVPDLIFTLLSHLWKKGQTPDDPYRLKFKEIVLRAPGIVSESEDPATWDQTKRKEYLSKVSSDYAAIFGGHIVVDEKTLYLHQDIFDIPKLYDDPAVSPDAEHNLIVALVREGIVQSLVTTNWDPLIERADEEAVGHRSRALKILACAEDFQAPKNGAIAELLKIHGCARDRLSLRVIENRLLPVSEDEL